MTKPPSPPTSPPQVPPRDGLYQVTAGYLCAGFVVKGGIVIACAPILHKRLVYWMTVATRVGD